MLLSCQEFALLTCIQEHSAVVLGVSRVLHKTFMRIVCMMHVA